MEIQLHKEEDEGKIDLETEVGSVKPAGRPVLYIVWPNLRTLLPRCSRDRGWYWEPGPHPLKGHVTREMLIFMQPCEVCDDVKSSTHTNRWERLVSITFVECDGGVAPPGISRF